MSRYVTKEEVMAGVRIVDIAKEFGVRLEDTYSGNFDYRCRCPSAEHKNGSERTGSLYIDSNRNNFYCFGCNAGSNCIDFYMLCTNTNFAEAISVLKRRVKPGNKIKHYVFYRNNFNTLLEISKLFRKTMLEHKDDLKWINKFMKYSDKYLFSLRPEEDDKTKEILKKIKIILKKRYGVK